MTEHLPIRQQSAPNGDGDLTGNELAWVHFIRLNSGNADPSPTLKGVQMLRYLLEEQNRKVV